MLWEAGHWLPHHYPHRWPTVKFKTTPSTPHEEPGYTSTRGCQKSYDVKIGKGEDKANFQEEMSQSEMRIRSSITKPSGQKEKCTITKRTCRNLKGEEAKTIAIWIMVEHDLPDRPHEFCVIHLPTNAIEDRKPKSEKIVQSQNVTHGTSPVSMDTEKHHDTGSQSPCTNLRGDQRIQECSLVRSTT
jgi:hypothetical protein